MCEPVALHDTCKYIYIVLWLGQRMACLSTRADWDTCSAKLHTFKDTCSVTKIHSKMHVTIHYYINKIW